MTTPTKAQLQAAVKKAIASEKEAWRAWEKAVVAYDHALRALANYKPKEKLR